MAKQGSRWVQHPLTLPYLQATKEATLPTLIGQTAAQTLFCLPANKTDLCPTFSFTELILSQL